MGEDVLSGFLGSRPVEVLGNPLASCRSWCSGRRPRRRPPPPTGCRAAHSGLGARPVLAASRVAERRRSTHQGIRRPQPPLVIRHPGDDHLGSHCQPIGDAALDLQWAARLADITRKIGINRLDELNRIKIESRLDLHRRSRHRLEILTPPAGSRLPAVRHDTIPLCPNPAEARAARIDDPLSRS